ncbi:hypothetical protein B0A48_10325 [Cryoendolithus antarcticus]|uniref:Cytochrome P450 n=1 Tax=Cryoendolithus antarcticus TaxID=1507870 RepID=A0A1V8SX75_9PEZI|nr:hypothetical protein B0A48_10325 [Cryoendolithus antarcticus]
MANAVTSHPVIAALLAIVVTLLGRFVQKGYKVRKAVHGAPGPPHSWIWGHLLVMNELMTSGEVPIKVHPHVTPLAFRQKYKLGPYFYLDFWPFGPVMLCCADPELGAQFTTLHSTRKHPEVVTTMQTIAGPGDLVSTSGSHWRKWRSVFNPGFAAQHLMSLVPGIVDDCKVFAEVLTALAEAGKPFRMEEYATRLTIDVIGKVVLNMRFDTQTGSNPMVNALRDQIFWIPNDTAMDPFKPYYPRGIYHRWQNSRTINNYLGEVLDKRFQEILHEKSADESTSSKERKRAIIDLAVESYDKEADSKTHQTTRLSSDFRRNAITQIRVFLFAGHDTTSAAICYALYYLSKDPSALSKIRHEHDAVLGPVEQTEEALKRDPYLISKLPYTTAVIKEVLRLNPAASSIRAADSQTHLTDPKTGEPLIMVPDMMLWLLHWSMHRDPEIWGPTVNTFNPDRFLPENAATLPEAYWRPFERGTRNCIGQDLAMIESRVALALVVRQFKFTAAFDAVNQMAGDGTMYGKDPKYREGRQELLGDEAYPVLVGTAKPREGMPMRVKLAA